MEKSDDKLISVIVPVYQGEMTIERCIRSILESSYCNIEVIVINDGSTDNTEKIVHRLMKENSCKNVIKYFRISNGGVAHARNVGLINSSGELIGFVDADDIIDSYLFEALSKSLYSGSDIAICGKWICDEKGVPLLRQTKQKKMHLQCPKEALSIVMWEQTIMRVYCGLFRREKIIDGNGDLLISFQENITCFEDFAFLCEYIYRCDGTMDILPFRYYFYCKRKGSLSCRMISPDELIQALHPILEIGKQVNDYKFTAHKIQYSFQFLEFWYVEALRCRKKEFQPFCEKWKNYMRELNRYADIYMMSNNVSLFRKCAMWIARRHPEVGRLLVKLCGKIGLIKA